MTLDERKSDIYDEWRKVLTFWFDHPELSFEEMIKLYARSKI